MTERKPFSIEQSEELIAQLKSETPSEFEQLRKTLKLLGQVPELSQGMVPPALPSTVNGNVVSLEKKRFSKSHRPILTSIITAGILASATLTAAAVTGRGPAPIVAVAHETAKFVKNVVGAVTSVVTGNKSNSPKDSVNTTADSQSPAVSNPTTNAPAPSNETTTENSLLPELTKVFPEVTVSPEVGQPETQTTEKPHADESKTPETRTTKSPSTPPLPSSGDNGVEGENLNNSNPSEKPKPEATQAPVVQPLPEATQAPVVQPLPEATQAPVVQPSETENS